MILHLTMSNTSFLGRQKYWIKMFYHNVMFNTLGKDVNKQIKFLTYSTIFNGKAKKIFSDEEFQSSTLSKNSKMIEKLANKLSLDIQVKKILEKHPDKLARYIKSPDFIYILDKNIARNISKKIMSNPAGEAQFLFEVNPGPGVMTSVFLENSKNKLRVFEKRQEFLPDLEALKIKYNKLETVTEDFLSLPTLCWRDIFNGEDTVDFMLKDINYIPWINSSPLQIFAIMPNNKKERSFLNYVLRSYMSLENIFSFGRTQLFLFVSEKEFKYMVATPNSSWIHYRHISVLYQTFFDIELLHVEPRSSFFPPLNEEQISTPFYSKGNMYLMMLTPKKTLFDVLSPDLLPEFGFFVFQHFTRRKSRVIQSLEKWIPNSNLYFLKQGLSLNTKFGELSSSQMLELFLNFSSMKEYSTSSFKVAVKSNSFHSAFNFDEENQNEEEINFRDLN